MRGLVFAFALLWLAASHGQAARPTLYFSCGVDLGSPLVIEANKLYQEAFNELGYDFELVFRPAMRSLADLSLGLTDGECGHPPGGMSPQFHENMVRVHARLLHIGAHFWTSDSANAGLSLQEIVQSPLKIGYLRGNFAIQETLSQRDANLNIPLKDVDQGVLMLATGRLDLLAATSPLVMNALKKFNLETKVSIALRGLEYDIYPYLHISHADLAEPLAKIINEKLSHPEHPLNRFSQPDGPSF